MIAPITDDASAVISTALAAESYADSPVSIYGTHPKLRSCDCGDNRDGTLPAQCVDSFGRYSHGDRGRILFHLSPPEWCWIVLAVSIVWTAEALNTAFEFLADAASPNFHPVVRDAKDVAAGAVLITALASSVIGAIIFWPHVKDLLGLNAIDSH